MQKLSELCVRRPVLAWVLILIMIVVGLVGFFRLGIDRFPQVDLPTVSVSASLPGATPETVETEITDKIEEAVNTIAGIDELTSSSREGSSSVRITFTLETDINQAIQDVRDRVARIQRSLPDEVEAPSVRRFDPDQSPIMTIAVFGHLPIVDLTEFADKTVRRQIENAAGVGDVQLRGERERQINIYPDIYQMRAFDVTATDLINALQTQNVEIPAGNLEQPKQTLTLRTLGRIHAVEDFNKILLRAGNGQQVRLQDVARVEDGLSDETTTSELNGKAAVQVSVYKQSGTNTLAVIENVKQRMEELRPLMPAGVETRIVRSQDEFIRAAVHSVEEHLIIGSMLASLVVLVFLWNWRSTLIAAFAIPTSIIATFAVMWVMGFTLNVITLLALTLAVGIVIDDAIVVLENIYRFIEEKGMPPMEAAIEGTREIGFAVMATTLSLIAVFLPVAFMTGIVGRFLTSFGLTMSFAIIVSLLVSFTLTPMLTARWLGRHWMRKRRQRAAQTAGSPAVEMPPPGHDAGSHGSDSHDSRSHDSRSHDSRSRGFYSFIDHLYTTMLVWSMKHRWAVVLICFGVLGSAPILWKMLPYNFLPEEDESQFQVRMEAPLGTSLEVTQKLAREVDAQLRRLPEVDYTLLTVGSAGYGAGRTNQASAFVALKPLEERKASQAEVIERIRGPLNRQFRPRKFKVRVSPGNSLWFIGGGSRIQYILSGPDLEVLQEAAERAVEEIKKIPGVADADTNLDLGQPEVTLRIDRDLAGELGVSPAVLASTLRYLVGGQQVTEYVENGEQYEVHLRASPQFRTDEAGIEMMTVPASSASRARSGGAGGGTAGRGSAGSDEFAPGSVALGQLISFSRTVGPATINRYNRRRQITLTADVEPGASEAAIGQGVERVVSNLGLGPGYAVTASGSSREQQRTNAAFLLALSMSVVFMYLILAAQFESWLHPITILLSLPLTIPFALLSLLLFGQTLNIFSLLGILVLFGVVKKNAILQIDHTNQLRERGMSRYDAIIQANRDRLRPILMTTLSFVAGMLPLVLARGVGAGTNNAIGTVIFGGQTLSLLLTLLAVPVAYSLFDDIAHFVTRLSHRFGFSDEPVEEVPAESLPS